VSTFPVPQDQEIRELLGELKRKVAWLESQAVQSAIAGAPPTGTAGGDLAGTYPNPTVAAVHGVSVSGTPVAGQAIIATNSTSATWQAVPVIPPFSYTGGLAVYTGDYRWYNDTGRTLTFGTIRASVGVAPTGASVIVDVLANGSTIFTTTGHRPTIAAGTNTAVNSAAPDVTTLANGSYLTVSIVQVGSTVAGSDLTVSVVMT
jgi:hypothetical protein